MFSFFKKIPHYDQSEVLSLMTARLGSLYYQPISDSVFDQYYALYQKAYAYEKDGKIDRALDYYFYIILNYTAIGTVYYDRPAIVLEKLKRYEEAAVITQMHVNLAKHPNAKLDLEGAEKRLQRLQKKYMRNE